MFFHSSQNRSRIFYDLKINFLFKTRQTNEQKTDKLTNSPINFENSRSKNNEKQLLSDRCRVNREKTNKLFHRVSEQQDLHPPVEYASYISFSCSFIFSRLVTAHTKPLLSFYRNYFYDRPDYRGRDTTTKSVNKASTWMLCTDSRLIRWCTLRISGHYFGWNSLSHTGCVCINSIRSNTINYVVLVGWNFLFYIFSSFNIYRSWYTEGK